MNGSSQENETVSDEEISELIKEHAQAHGVPEEVLLEIYTSEEAVVGMNRRGTIFKDIDDILKNHVDEQLSAN